MAKALRWFKSMTGGEISGGSSRADAVSQPRDAHETPTTFGDRERNSVAIMPFKNLATIRKPRSMNSRLPTR